MKYGKKSTTMKKSKSTKKGLTDRQKQTLKKHWKKAIYLKKK